MEVGLLQTNNIYILGGGPAGISLSHYLSKLKIKNTLIEARNIVGGMARSWIWNDFIVDTGPHILHTDDMDIWDLWKKYLDDNLSEKLFYSGNFKTINKKSYIYDYPLNIEQIRSSDAWPKDKKDKILGYLKNSFNSNNLGEATSFRDYMQNFVGETLEKSFFRYYPEKVWGIPTNEMLPDWAPKRIRICNFREPFYKGELAGIAEKGTGELMQNILKESCKTFTNVLLNSKIINLKSNRNKISGIEIIDNENKKQLLKLEENDLVINTLPISLISQMLGKKVDISFRGIVSIYAEIESSCKKILPEDFNWLYFGDQKINFNRITEPTSMSSKLDLTNSERKYLILETCLNQNTDKNKIKEKIEAASQDLVKLPFINSKIINSSYNWEQYVYPIQTLDNRINLKEIQNWISQKASNLESLGTSADFAYNDIQVIFKKAKELASDIANSERFNLSKLYFNKLIENKATLNLKKGKGKKKEIYLDQSIISSFQNKKPCAIIAEIGINHNGSIDQLLKLCELACKSGASIIKFQYFDAKKRIGSSVRELEHIEKAQDMEENILQLLDRCQLNIEDLKKAKNYVNSKGCECMCTPFSESSFQELINIGFNKIKISSMDLNNLHLHKKILETKKKLDLFISTGMSNLSELETIYEIYAGSFHNICLLLCTSSYPAPNNDISLSNILKFKKLFPKFKIGYSDHSVGNTAAITASTLGAEFIELHFSDDIRKSGPDQILSKTGADISLLKNKFISIAELIEFKEKDLRISEYATWRTQKKGLYASKEIKEGSKITLDNTICESPPTDVSPLILNNNQVTAKKFFKKGEAIIMSTITIS